MCCCLTPYNMVLQPAQDSSAYDGDNLLPRTTTVFCLGVDNQMISFFSRAKSNMRYHFSYGYDEILNLLYPRKFTFKPMCYWPLKGFWLLLYPIPTASDFRLFVTSSCPINVLVEITPLLCEVPVNKANKKSLSWWHDISAQLKLYDALIFIPFWMRRHYFNISN